MKSGAPFPTFDKSCKQSSDCEVVTHHDACCGVANVAIGINQSELSRFNDEEVACNIQCPASGCQVGGKAEDGKDLPGAGGTGRESFRVPYGRLRNSAPRVKGGT